MNERERQFRSLYRRLRIENQQKFYSARVAEYRSAHRQVVVVRNALLLAAAALGVVSEATDGSARGAWAVVAAVLGSLAGAVTAFDSLIGFPQLAKLYADAERNLEEAAIDWEGTTAQLTEEFERVEWIFRSERGQWGQLVVRAATATQPAGRVDRGDGGESGGGTAGPS